MRFHKAVRYGVSIAVLPLMMGPVTAGMAHDDADRPDRRAAELARILVGERPERQAIDAILSAPPGGGLSPAMQAAKASRTLQVFFATDDLAYVGNEFVGCWVVPTPKGIILVDALSSAEDVDAFLLPGLAQMGLKPADIRYLVITHGHYDHAGGAETIMSRYGAKLIMSEADWRLWNATAETGSGTPLPAPASFAADGDVVQLGRARLELFLTPGHTPGTISAFISAHNKGRPVLLSLWGGNALPRTLEPNARSGGLYAYRRSLIRFAELGRVRGAVGMISSHPMGDGSLAKAALTQNNPQNANPWLVGEDYLMRFQGAYIAVTEAAIAQLERTAPRK